MGNWIELVKDRKGSKSHAKNIDLPDATFKRTLLGLQSGGLYMKNSRTLLRGAPTPLASNKMSRTQNHFLDFRSQLSGFRNRPVSGASIQSLSTPQRYPQKQSSLPS